MSLTEPKWLFRW